MSHPRHSNTSKKTELSEDSPSRGTDSDTLLADLVDKRLLALEGLSTLIKAIKSGAFDSNEVTLQSAEEVFIRRVNLSQLSLSKSESAGVVGLPRVVLQCVIDGFSGILKSYYSLGNKFACNPIDECEMHVCQTNFEVAKFTLEDMSLVHSSWALMVYRALGHKVEVIRDRSGVKGRDSNWVTLFRNPAFGSWTRTLAYTIGDFISEFDAVQRSFYVSKLPLRFAHIRKLELSFYQISVDFFRVFGELVQALDAELEDIVIIQVGTRWSLGMFEFPDTFFQLLAHIPHLRSLRMSYAGKEIHGIALPIEFQPLIDNPTFIRLQLDLINYPDAEGIEFPALEYTKAMLWIRSGAQSKSLFTLRGLRLARLRWWGKQSREREAQRKQRVTRAEGFKSVIEHLSVLHVDFFADWQPEEYNFTHCKALRELSANIREADVEAFLRAIPQDLETLSLVIRGPGTEFEITDDALQNRLKSNSLPKLRRIQLRYHSEGSPMRMAAVSGQTKVPAASSIPHTFMACRDRDVEYAIWF